MSMTPEQLAYVKRMLGTYACNFDNTLLYNLYDDSVMQGATNALSGVIALAFYQLLVGAVGLTNFRQGETQEDESVIFGRLNQFFDRWNAQAGFPEPLPTFTIQTVRLFYIDFTEDDTDDQ
jgi:hypothetical protein